MYIRKVKTRNKITGADYFTYRLVKNIREDGVPKQINLLSLGKLEAVKDNELNMLSDRIEQLYNHETLLFSRNSLAPMHIEELAHFFTEKLVQKNFVQRPNKDTDYLKDTQLKDYVEIDINSLTGKTSEQIGGEYLCVQAIEELGLESFLKDSLSFTGTQVDNSILALIGRLLYSSSESQTARWLSDNSAILDFYPQDSGKVSKSQLYSAANLLYEHRGKIEAYLNRTTEKIFDFKRKIVLYDLTNTHFEGQMKQSKKATYGHNKQKRYDCKQITLALLTDENGFPIQSKYYSGNISEPKTLEAVLDDLSIQSVNLFTSEKPCIIMDAGIATDASVKLLLQKGYEYICVSRSGHKDLIDKVDEKKLVTFKNKSEKELSAQLFKQEFTYQDNNKAEHTINESLIYIKSPDKEKKESAIDEKKCTRFEEGLKMIEKTINKPRGQREISKIHQRLGRLKERNKGITGFYDIEIKDDTSNVISINWKRKEQVSKEKKQGVYFLRTNIDEKSEEKLWKLYRIVNEVEEAFSTLKSELGVRPNFHHSDATIEAHINLCVLAYYVVSFVRYRLKSKGINYCWAEICRIMSIQKRTLFVSQTKNNKALWVKTCTVPNPQVEKIYQTMGYKIIPFYRKTILI